MDLHEDDVEAFEQICQWLYTRACPTLQWDTFDQHSFFFRRITTAYAAAEKYGMAKLKNHLIDLLFSCQKCFPEAPHPEIENVKYVYDTTPTNSPLRRLMIGWFTWPVNRTISRIEVSPYTLSTVPEFAIDVACNAIHSLNSSGEKSPFDLSELEREINFHEEVPRDLEHSDDEDNITINSEAAHESGVE